MPVTMPKGVHDALGERAAQEMAEWIEELVQERTVVRDEYREVLSRLDLMEHRIGSVDTQVSQLRTDMDERFDRLRTDMDERFDRLRTEMTGFRSDIDTRFDALHERFDTLYDRMLVQTRWLIGSIVVFGTVVTILLAIAQFR